MLGGYYPGLLYFGESDFSLLDPYSGPVIPGSGFYDRYIGTPGELESFDPGDTGNYTPSDIPGGDYSAGVIDDTGEYV